MTNTTKPATQAAEPILPDERIEALSIEHFYPDASTMDERVLRFARAIEAELRAALGRAVAPSDAAGVEPVKLSQQQNETITALRMWSEAGHRDLKLSRGDKYGVQALLAGFDLAASGSAQPASKMTDITHHLRYIVAVTPEGAMSQLSTKTVLAAADEIERYYGGMMAWRATASKKDADYNAERMARIDERCAQRATQATTVTGEAAEAGEMAVELLPLPEANMYDTPAGLMPRFTASQMRSYAAACSVQPTRDAVRLDFIAEHPEKQLRYHKRRWALVSFTNYEYDVFKTPREAIDAAIKAMAPGAKA